MGLPAFAQSGSSSLPIRMQQGQTGGFVRFPSGFAVEDGLQAPDPTTRRSN